MSTAQTRRDGWLVSGWAATMTVGGLATRWATTLPGMVEVGMQTFRGLVSVRDSDHDRQLTMSGLAGLVSDALLAVVAAAGMEAAEPDPDLRLVAVEQRIRVLAPVEVGESIEIVSGVVALSPQGLTAAHIVVAVSSGRSTVAHAWSETACTGANREPTELSADAMRSLERLKVAESELFHG